MIKLYPCPLSCELDHTGSHHQDWTVFSSHALLSLATCIKRVSQQKLTIPDNTCHSLLSSAFGGSLRWWRSFAFVNMSKLAEKVASCCLGEITQARVTRKLWRLTRLRTWSGELQVDTGICVIGSLNHAAQVRLVVNYATTETDFWQQWMQMDAGCHEVIHP